MKDFLLYGGLFRLDFLQFFFDRGFLPGLSAAPGMGFRNLQFAAGRFGATPGRKWFRLLRLLRRVLLNRFGQFLRLQLIKQLVNVLLVAGGGRLTP